MFLKTGFPESLGAANVAKVALSTSKLINYTRHQRFGKPVFKWNKTARLSDAPRRYMMTSQVCTLQICKKV